MAERSLSKATKRGLTIQHVDLYIIFKMRCQLFTYTNLPSMCAMDYMYTTTAGKYVV